MSRRPKNKKREEEKAVVSLLPLIKKRPHEAEATAGSRNQETGEPASKKNEIFLVLKIMFDILNSCSYVKFSAIFHA